MSAIWGMIDTKRDIPKKIISNMRQSMEEFKLDRLDSKEKSNVYFACGHQYFTKEAILDVSPYYDEEKHIWYTGDCFLYNRQEVIQKLRELHPEKTIDAFEKSGDAMLTYFLYKSLGEDFVTYLRGSFALAFYEEGSQQVLLYTDHVAQRYLAYYYDGEKILFSTLYQPFLASLGKKDMKICREWIVAAYTDCSADTLRIPGKTVWEKIYQVEPGNYVKINLRTGQVNNVCYWNPLCQKVKQTKKTDEEYREQFLTVFKCVTNGMLRSRKHTGIMLSGGLDSSAVAAMAAKELERNDKVLYSYTAVPVSDYPFQNDAYFIENERDWISIQQKIHPNIKSKFIEVPKANCFTNLETYINTFMEPVKPALNMIYVEGMSLAAAKDECSILLSGQNGNATISYGNLLSFIYQKSIRGHFLSAYKEIKAFGSLRKIGRKRILAVYLKTLMELRFQKVRFGKDCLLKEKDIKDYQLLSMEKKIREKRGNGVLDTKRQRRGFCFMPLVFQHMGFYNTYCSLKYGVLSLDPTLTKEMIELCLSMPIECYVHGGKERRMVRDYMKGLVPEEILENHTGRGIQSADFAYRINRDWDKIKEQVYDILQEPLLIQYLDRDKLNALLDEIRENEYQMSRNLVARMTVISSLGYFLRMADGQ